MYLLSCISGTGKHLPNYPNWCKIHVCREHLPDELLRACSSHFIAVNLEALMAFTPPRVLHALYAYGDNTDVSNRNSLRRHWAQHRQRVEELESTMLGINVCTTTAASACIYQFDWLHADELRTKAPLGDNLANTFIVMIKSLPWITLQHLKRVTKEWRDIAMWVSVPLLLSVHRPTLEILGTKPTNKSSSIILLMVSDASRVV